MGPVASFHLITERSGRQPLVLARLAADRRPLARVDGALFTRTLGTGRGSNTGPSIDARRTALFAVWRDADAVETFLAEHPLAERWRGAAEHWSTVLAPCAARGLWSGFEIPVRTPLDESATSQVVVLTRATIRPGATLPFLRTSREMAATMGGTDGLRAVVGVGERPIGRHGTFSVWRDLAAARRFASGEAHQRAASAARRGGWFSEELFATFVPVRAEGTWDGADPLGQPR